MKEIKKYVVTLSFKVYTSLFKDKGETVAFNEGNVVEILEIGHLCSLINRTSGKKVDLSHEDVKKYQTYNLKKA